MVTGFVAIIIAYLLGSIPSAYIITRLRTGKDIRQLGGGNIGGLNVFREVGPWPALAVGIVDLGKGAAAVAVAYWLLEVSTPFVLLAGLMSVVGHNWMVWLRFSGGKGMGAAFGALAILFPVYGYWQGFLIFLGIILVPFIITRNVALSIGVGLVSLPFITWFLTKSELATTFAVILGLIILVKFLPTALAAIKKSGVARAFGPDRWQREQNKKRKG